MREKCAAATAAVFLFAGTAWASRTATLRGELTCEACNNYTDLLVELTDVSGNRPAERTMVRGTGEFEFNNIPVSNYTLTVTSAGRILKSEIISVRDQGGVITIHIPRAYKDGAKAPGGVISVARLQHKVPKNARKEYNKAQERFEGGDIDGSLAHLKRATEIDPEYVEAINNLGCRYLMKQQLPEAIAQFRRALQIDPQARLVHSNLALALIGTGQFDDAERFARQALSIDPRPDKSRYVLALTLYAQRKFTDETVELLRDLTDKFPRARLALAAALANRGDREGARAVLKRYLSAETVVEKQVAEEMLASLR